MKTSAICLTTLNIFRCCQVIVQVGSRHRCVRCGGNSGGGMKNFHLPFEALVYHIMKYWQPVIVICFDITYLLNRRKKIRNIVNWSVWIFFIFIAFSPVAIFALQNNNSSSSSSTHIHIKKINTVWSWTKYRNNFYKLLIFFSVGTSLEHVFLHTLLRYIR